MAVPKKAPAKKKPAAKSGQVEVSKSDLLKRYKKHDKAIARAGKETAPTGYVEDKELIKIFGLKPGSGVTCKARLTQAKFVQVGEYDVLKVKFIVQKGKGQGTPVSHDFFLDPNDDDATEKTLKEITFMLQKLGYDTTTKLTMEQLIDLAEDLSEEKPYCVIYVNCYKQKQGKRKGELRVGVRVNSPYDPEDEESEDDEEDEDEDDDSDEDEDSEEEEDEDSDEEEDSEDDDDEDDEEEEEPVKKSTKKSTTASKKTTTKKSGSQSKTSDADEEDEEEDEEEEEAPKSKSKKAAPTAKSSKTAAPSKSKKKEEPEYEDVEDDEEEDTVDPDDASTWIGQTAKVKPTGEKKLGNWEITKFDKKKNLLTIKQGKVTKTCSPDDVKDFVDEE